MDERSEVNLLVQNPTATTIMSPTNNPHLLPDFNADTVEDEDFGNFIDEDDDIKQENILMKGVPKEGDDSDDSEEEDDDSVSSLQKISSTKNGNSKIIKRNDSWLSFVSRSERNHLVGKEAPPTAEEIRSRRVRFVDEEKLETVHEVDQVDPEDKPNYWMTSEDFDRLENELKLTRFRWENHKTGKIQMDENTTSIRGLELMLKDPELKAARGVQPWQHTRNVLQEIVRQKTDNGGKEIDWEKVRQESLRSSAKGVEHGYVTGKEDEKARLRAWDPSASSVKNGNTSNGDENKKKKSKGKGFFSFFGGKK